MTFNRLLVVLFVVVAANGFLFMRLNPDRMVPGTDSREYDLMARNLVDGHGLSLASQEPYLPTLYREPGYPVLVGVLYRAFGPDVDAVVVVQVLLLAVAAVVTALVGARLFGPLAGLIAGAWFGLNPESAHYAHWLLTEILFALLLVLTVALALRAQRDGSARDYILTGVGLGLATLVRAVASGLIPPLLVLLGVTGAFGVGRWVRWQRLALMVAGFGVVVAPWLARNAETFGRASLTSRIGVNLVRRAPRAAQPLSAYAADIVASVWIATNPLSQVIYPISRFQWGPSYEDNLIWDFHVNEEVRYLWRYQPQCQTAPDEDQCFADVGMAFVRQYPLQYLVQSVFELVKLLFTPLPSAQALIHNTTLWLAIVTGAVLAWRRQLGAPHVLVIGVVLAFVLESVALDTQVRYVWPFLPYVTAFAAVPVGWVVNRLVSRAPARHKGLFLERSR
jgi:4-amino-4-deoxy-L-arabinose transferase-like glycosyltransferase